MMASLFSLEGKTALVTGGNGGLGRSMAIGLRSAGANVVVTGRNSEKNNAVSHELGDSGMTVSLDVRDENAVREAVSEVVARFGSLDILVNNAGVAHRGPVLNLTQEDWDIDLDTNLTGSFLCAKHAGQAMVAAGNGGKIVNVGSIYAIYGTPASVSYGASKAGVLGLTRGLAIELAQHDIQVNAIIPGWYLTDMTTGYIGSPIKEEIRRKTPAGRWGTPEDLIGAVVFLASAASNFVTGVGLPVDGGYLISERLADA
ncbi:MAG: glucose 1-dehydrogenase [Actinomycetota bacterium]|nr:glucose 1-dehydrogenase [Actinomycetota bacterium]